MAFVDKTLQHVCEIIESALVFVGAQRAVHVVNGVPIVLQAAKVVLLTQRSLLQPREVDEPKDGITCFDRILDVLFKLVDAPRTNNAT